MNSDLFPFSLKQVKILEVLSLFACLVLTISCLGLAFSDYYVVKERGWIYEQTMIIEGVSITSTVNMHTALSFNYLLAFITLINWVCFAVFRYLAFVIENIN